jgi:dTDP-6-deoxy-L-talose 4-dehydrogenase (NAD+)
MKVLVTGASGFIGNYVVEQLLDSKQEVIATAIENYEQIQSRFNWHNKVRYIQKDLNEIEENCYEFFDKPDLLLHLSWQGLPHYKELFHIERNLMANYEFIKNLVSKGLKNVVCIGTCFEYGLQEGSLKENVETKPSTTYGLAKDTLRRFIEELQKHYAFDFKWLRLFYPYGKGQNPKSLLSQLDKAIANNDKTFNLTSGEQLRDYLPVEKAAEYIVKVSLQNKINGIINICSGEPISVKQFVENYLLNKNAKIELNLGYYPYPDYEPMAFWGDTHKLEEAINSGIK